MTERLSPQEDPMMMQALQDLIAFYKETYREVTNAVVSQLRDDLIHLAGLQMAKDVGDLFEKEYTILSPSNI